MSEDRFKGLTKGDHRALDALGVERLEDNERTAVYRVTAPAWVHEILSSLPGKSKSRSLGELLTEKLKS